MSLGNFEANVECPFCKRGRGAHLLFCESCGHLFPAPQSCTHFDRLGMAQTFHIDIEELQENLLELSRRFHPDFFATKEPDQKELSLEHSSALNVAHSILRDPFRRAEYLLEILGAPSSSEDKRTPAGFLQETLFLREELEEALEENNKAAISLLNEKLTKRKEKTIQDLESLFQQIELDEKKDGIFGEIRMTLNSAKYINGLIRDSSGLRQPF